MKVLDYRLEPVPLRWRRRGYRIARARALAYFASMRPTDRDIMLFVLVRLVCSEFVWMVRHPKPGVATLGRFVGMRPYRTPVSALVPFNPDIERTIRDLQNGRDA